MPPAPGIRPSRISGWPSLASSAAIRKSAQSASSQPPPRAYPVTAATTGLGMRATAVNASCRSRERRTIAAWSIACISLMSAPAANTFSPP
ncbi:hypothetical protein SALBM311S_07318 [Streptomyces alboniger]